MDLITKASNKIASVTEPLMKTLQVKSNVYLLSSYHTYFLFTHFKCLQLGDPTIGDKKAGYLNRHITVRYFLVYENLTNADHNTNWKSLPAFCPFYESIRNLPPNAREEQDFFFLY